MITLQSDPNKKLDTLHIGLPQCRARGRYQISVINPKGEVVEQRPWQSNLILDQGMDQLDTRRWNQVMLYCAAGTGTTATKDILDGDWSRSGTTVTSSGSSYTLTSGDVGKWIRFADGTQAKITAYVSATQVTTANHSGTVAAQGATLYRANQTGLTTEVKRSSTYPDYQDPDLSWSNTTRYNETTGEYTLRRTFDFSAETGSVNYTEVGVSPTVSAGANLFSRILIDGVVAVTSGNQLRVRYELTITTSPLPLYAGEQATELSITGWPRPYTITSITSTGSNFTVTFSESHHYVAGGKINLSNVKRPRYTITAATSTASDFTLTTSAAHGIGVGETIVVEGVTPSGYNGEWVTVAGTTGSTIVVTTTANPGTGTVFGNVRLKEPTTWYNGEWTVASTTSTTVVVTSALNLGSAGEGTCVNNLKYKLLRNGWGIEQLRNSGSGTIPVPGGFTWYFGSGTTSGDPGTNASLLDPSTAIAICTKTDGQSPSYTFSTQMSAHTAIPSSTAKTTYVNGNFYQEYTCEFSAGQVNIGTLNWIGIRISTTTSRSATPYNILFTEPQRKDSTHKLRLVIRRSWDRVLA